MGEKETQAVTLGKEKMKQSKILERIKGLQLELGGLIEGDIEKVFEATFSEEERKEFAGIASVMYEKFLGKVFSAMVFEELKRVAFEAQVSEQNIYIRGTINSLLVIDDFFRNQQNIHKEGLQENQNEKDEDNKTEGVL